MEIRQLRYFVTVATTRHFGQAAEQLHMSQSPLSQAIRQLEAQVGATLLTRTTRRVDLTPAGEAFLRDAQRILAAVETAEARAKVLDAGNAGLLRIGATGLAAFRHLPRLARIAAQRVPGLVLRFEPDLLTPAQELALDEDRIDLGVLRPPLRPRLLASRLICRERLVLVVPETHHLAGRQLVEVVDLQDEDFVTYGVPDSVVDVTVTQACLAAGFLPRRSIGAGQAPMILTLVAAGLGVAVLPESVQALKVEGIRVIPVADDVHVDLALAWRRDDSSPVLSRLLEVLEDGGFFAATAAPDWESASGAVVSGDAR